MHMEATGRIPACLWKIMRPHGAKNPLDWFVLEGKTLVVPAQGCEQEPETAIRERAIVRGSTN